MNQNFQDIVDRINLNRPRVISSSGEVAVPAGANHALIEAYGGGGGGGGGTTNAVVPEHIMGLWVEVEVLLEGT